MRGGRGKGAGTRDPDVPNFYFLLLSMHFGQHFKALESDEDYDYSCALLCCDGRYVTVLSFG